MTAKNLIGLDNDKAKELAGNLICYWLICRFFISMQEAFTGK